MEKMHGMGNNKLEIAKEQYKFEDFLVDPVPYSQN